MKVQGIIKLVSSRQDTEPLVSANANFRKSALSTNAEKLASRFDAVYIKLASTSLSMDPLFINVNLDGTFSKEDEVFDDPDNSWICQVYKGPNSIKNAGTVTNDQLQKSLTIEVGESLLGSFNESTASYFEIPAKIAYISPQPATAPVYNLELIYLLKDLKGVKESINNTIKLSVRTNEVFTIRIIEKYKDYFLLDKDSPLQIRLSDGKAETVLYDLFLSDGSSEKSINPVKPSEIGTGSLLLKVQAKKPEDPVVSINPVPAVNPNKKLKGKVVHDKAKIKIRNNQVILSAIPDNADQKPVVIAICLTDGEGNFSAPFPFGKFKSASAVVSIKTDEIKDIPLSGDGNFPDFVWIVLQTLPESMTQDEHDDCSCNDRTPSLPDMDELISNNAYSQDIGGSCNNLTTPNRSLEEFSYYSVIRTSDPELFDCPLDETIERLKYITERITSIKQQINSYSPYASKQIDFRKLINLPELEIVPAQTEPQKQIPKNKSGKTLQLKQAEKIKAGEQLAFIKKDAAFLPAHEFLGSTVYNPNALALQKELNVLTIEQKRLKRILENRGRIPLNGKSPIDWDDSDGKLGVVQASTIAYGHLLRYKQVWRADGYSLGELLYSLPLAPGQKKQIAVMEWERKETASRAESLDAIDRLSNEMSHDRDINEIVNANTRENTAGTSHSTSTGFSKGIGAGTGAGVSTAGNGSMYGIPISVGTSGMLGISGGVNKSKGESWSDATQISTRNLSAVSDQRLRERTMQNASSIRSQRASVITSVGQSESINITTEVIANHNHCHAITIEYFEVLRHFAIHQELSDVQECLFVPMLIESFDRRKILRWRDLLSTYLYAPKTKYHTLLAGFDALQRIEDFEVKQDLQAYANFPTGRFCDEMLEEVSGVLTFRLKINRPQHVIPANASYESIRASLLTAFSFPGLGHWWTPNINAMAEHLAKIEAQKIEAEFQKMVFTMVESFISALNINFILMDGTTKNISLDVTTLTKKRINSPQANLQRNYDESNPFGEFELVISYKPQLSTFASLHTISRADIKAVEISNVNKLPDGSYCMIKSGSLSYGTKHYSGYLFNSNSLLNDISSGDSALILTKMTTDELRNPRIEDKKNAQALEQHLDTNKEYYHKVLWTFLDDQRLFNLLDKYSIQVPKISYLTFTETDGSISSVLELDADNKPIIKYVPRSVASVVELKKMGMAGNSLIFPVARGFNLNPDFLLIPSYRVETRTSVQKRGNKDETVEIKVGAIESESTIELMDLYKPLPGTKHVPQPFRVSVPTKGLFAEAVQGACNSCEKIDDRRFWKWEEHPIDEPTAINPVSSDSRRSDPGDLKAKDFASPILNIQNAPAVPDPQGLAAALQLMGKADIFKDITGLTETQKNALQALTSNQAAAQSFGEQAGKLAIAGGSNAQDALKAGMQYDLQKGAQMQNSLDKLKDAPIDPEDKEALYKKGLNKLLGDSENEKGLAEAAKDAATKDDSGKYDGALKVIDKVSDSKNIELSGNGDVKIEGLDKKPDFQDPNGLSETDESIFNSFFNDGPNE